MRFNPLNDRVGFEDGQQLKLGCEMFKNKTPKQVSLEKTSSNN
jgi:hypothetical protein